MDLTKTYNNHAKIYKKKAQKQEPICNGISIYIIKSITQHNR